MDILAAMGLVLRIERVGLPTLDEMPLTAMHLLALSEPKGRYSFSAGATPRRVNAWQDWRAALTGNCSLGGRAGLKL